MITIGIYTLIVLLCAYFSYRRGHKCGSLDVVDYLIEQSYVLVDENGELLKIKKV